MRLSQKLTLSFLLSIFISIIIISIMSNFMINNRFESYLESEQESRFKRIHEEVNKTLNEDPTNLKSINLKQYAITEGISLIIKNNENETIYNTNTGMGMGMGLNRSRMHMKHRFTEGNYTEIIYPLTNDDNNSLIGSLIIGYIDNSYLSDSAFIFKDTLSHSFIISGIITTLIGIIISIFLSRGLTLPLINITNTANKIRSGDLTAKSIVKTNTTEVVELSDSINYLGNTLSQQEEIRKRYASDISHELRTPLTTLKSHVEAIMDNVWEPTHEHLEILMDEISRLSNLVDNLKDTFTQEENKMNMNKSKFNISQELKKITTNFEPLYKKENCIIHLSVQEDLEVFMDLDKFTQIINNLLTNSLRYLNDNGEVFIYAERTPKTIVLRIKDNGIGINEKDIPHIFDRFYRVDTSRNYITGGSGLGLSIVKSIVEAHNGSISVKSNYGIGTEFEIVFPLN